MEGRPFSHSQSNMATLDQNGTLMNHLAAHGMYTQRNVPQRFAQQHPIPAQSRQSLIKPQQQRYPQMSSTSSLRPRPAENRKDVFTWTVDEVVNWLCRNCSGDISARYSQSFRFHDINGRALMRLDDEKLERLGVDHPNHRYELLNEILKQKLRFHEQYFKKAYHSAQPPNVSTRVPVMSNSVFGRRDY
ncbi:unnamed protein product [Oikopleura dioica]|uniref:SAM domain-containing protein n=2 Tax=Oikopleura dioica TaxID=34765 RepID=E4WWN8_OIKDI|nr:unnamed protein product [Oikopleura dioica]